MNSSLYLVAQRNNIGYHTDLIRVSVDLDMVVDGRKLLPGTVDENGLPALRSDRQINECKENISEELEVWVRQVCLPVLKKFLKDYNLNAKITIGGQNSNILLCEV